MLSEERIKELREHVSSLEHPEEALADLMHEAQEAYGYLSDEAAETVADIAGVPVIKVDELATFYNLIFRRPVGRKVIFVCDSISCWVMGMENLFDHLKKQARYRNRRHDGGRGFHPSPDMLPGSVPYSPGDDGGRDVVRKPHAGED